MKLNRESSSSTIISLSAYMRIFAEVCLRNTSFYSPSYWLWKYCSETMRLIMKNGDIILQVQLEKLKLWKIQLIGSVNWNGLKHTSSCSQCQSSLYLRASITFSFKITKPSKKFLTIQSHTTNQSPVNGTKSSILYRRWSSLNQLDLIKLL